MSAREHGVAIVLAMGVVALAAIAATAIAVTQTAWSRQHELTSDHAQSRTLVSAGIDWSRAVLADDRRTSSVDHRGEAWAIRVPATTVENGEVAGWVEDQQALFNLNNLVRDGKASAPHLREFRRLLALLALPAALADALADWIDADSEPQPQNGAEDRYYLARVTPYLPANRPLGDVGELALVRGFDEAVRARLRPYVTALPTATALNVNTAPAEVLAAVVEGLDIDAARALAVQRDTVYFRTPADFTRELPRGANARGEDVGVASEYFIVEVRTRFGEARARGTALLSREGPGWPRTLWRKVL
jgi:general secretion pathway protein K